MFWHNVRYAYVQSKASQLVITSRAGTLLSSWSTEASAEYESAECARQSALHRNPLSPSTQADTSARPGSAAVEERAVPRARRGGVRGHLDALHQQGDQHANAGWLGGWARRPLRAAQGPGILRPLPPLRLRADALPAICGGAPPMPLNFIPLTWT